jgi:hypothetical protein
MGVTLWRRAVIGKQEKTEKCLFVIAVGDTNAAGFHLPRLLADIKGRALDHLQVGPAFLTTRQCCR